MGGGPAPGRVRTGTMGERPCWSSGAAGRGTPEGGRDDPDGEELKLSMGVSTISTSSVTYSWVARLQGVLMSGKPTGHQRKLMGIKSGFQNECVVDGVTFTRGFLYTRVYSHTHPHPQRGAIFFLRKHKFVHKLRLTKILRGKIDDAVWTQQTKKTGGADPALLNIECVIIIHPLSKSSKRKHKHKHSDAGRGSPVRTSS